MITIKYPTRNEPDSIFKYPIRNDPDIFSRKIGTWKLETRNLFIINIRQSLNFGNLHISGSYEERKKYNMSRLLSDIELFIEHSNAEF